MICFCKFFRIQNFTQMKRRLVRRCGHDCDIVIADGRLAIAGSRDGEFDLIMLDAFSSNSIPAHLVSREALQIYQTKLKPNGLILFHVSNLYLDVGKLVASVVRDAGLLGLYRSDRDEVMEGKSGSDYVLAARNPEDFGDIVTRYHWVAADPGTDIRPWTDDYSNMLPLLKWQ